MTRLSFCLLVLSFSAFASNHELDDIFNKYHKTLMNFKIGMTSTSINENTSFYADENAILSARSSKDVVKTVILKVIGTSVYEYEVTTNVESGQKSITVSLNDHKYNSADNVNVSNISITNEILLADFSGNYTDQYSSYVYSGSMTKDLLSSFFCGYTNIVQAKYTDNSTGVVYPMNDNEVNKCGTMMSVDEIKGIDLSEVQFCNNTLPDNSGEVCEITDMSFLTADL